MADRPILFSPPMVRALLDGRKTQTRRIVKPQPQPNYGKGLSSVVPYHTTQGKWTWVLEVTGHGDGTSGEYCPYGKPGDLLWVRETWALASRATDIAKIYYKAHEQASHTEFHEYVPVEKIGNYQPTWPKYKPSIHMPRWASRITIELTKVDVEKLQDINERDAKKEGADPVSTFEKEFYHGFRMVWQKINGVESWNTNPWVWVLEFKVHQQNIDQLIKSRES